MAKTPHGFPVGMWAFNGSTGTSTQDAFKADLREVYAGEENIPFEACNHIQSYGDGMCWNNVSNEPSSGSGGYTARETRILNNIEAWITYLKMIRDICNENGLPPGGIKGIISRCITGIVEPLAAQLGNWPLGAWDQPPNDELAPYIKGLCYRIKQEQLESYVAGWYLADEVFTKAQVWINWTSDKFRDTVLKVHDAQKNPRKYDPHDQNPPTQTACNFPFYWADHVDTENNAINANRNFWTFTSAPLRRDYHVPQEFRNWVNVFNLQALQDAVLVFMPFYYPWGSVQTQWRYRKYALSDQGILSQELPDNPPWRLWSIFMSRPNPYTPADDSLHDAFPPASYPQLRFEPIIEASSQGKAQNPYPPPAEVPFMFPRHLDIHKSTRVLLNLRKHWIQDISDSRFTGLWYCGWKQTGTPNFGDAANQHWTQPGSADMPKPSRTKLVGERKAFKRYGSRESTTTGQSSQTISSVSTMNPGQWSRLRDIVFSIILPRSLC